MDSSKSNGITLSELNYKDFIGKKVLVIDTNVVLTPEILGKPETSTGEEENLSMYFDT